MRLKFDYEIVDMGSELMAVPIGEEGQKVHGILRLNKEGAEVLELLGTEISKERMVEILSEKYENEREKLLVYVTEFVEKLAGYGFVE